MSETGEQIISVPEATNINQEPGIVRNVGGRIVATGWPLEDTSKWPIAYQDLGESIAKQVRYELFVKKEGRPDRDGYQVTPETSFVLSRTDLSPYLKKALLEIPWGNEEEVLKICDIGGG